MTYRVYFNREREWPQCWSIDEGDQTTEINVVGFALHGVEAVSFTHDRQARIDRDATPFAWLEVRHAQFSVGNGVAVFTPQDCGNR